jgi:hypothetical protein
VAVKALRRASGRWTAQIALVLLLVQLFAAGFGSAAHAAAPQLDAFGNVLCLAGEPGTDMPAGDPSGFHDCCTFGCGSAFSPLVAPLDPVAQPAFYPRSFDIVAPEPAHLAAPDRPTRPGSPRAPPIAI